MCSLAIDLMVFTWNRLYKVFIFALVSVDIRCKFYDYNLVGKIPAHGTYLAQI